MTEHELWVEIATLIAIGMFPDEHDGTSTYYEANDSGLCSLISQFEFANAITRKVGDAARARAWQEVNENPDVVYSFYIDRPMYWSGKRTKAVKKFVRQTRP